MSDYVIAIFILSCVIIVAIIFRDNIQAHMTRAGFFVSTSDNLDPNVKVQKLKKTKLKIKNARRGSVDITDSDDSDLDIIM